MTMRTLPLLLSVAAVASLTACGERRSGPVLVSAVGARPELINPNLRPLDPPAAFLLGSVAQGLVHFDASGEIEPALAQSWIVSDDGRRYTFRIRRTNWTSGGPVNAHDVAARLRAAASRASRNALKPVLGGIENIVAMTDQVLEITLRGPRPNLLQLLAQPEMAVLLNGAGTGPYAIIGVSGGAPLLSPLRSEEGERGPGPDVILQGERAAAAVARFAAGEADLALGGTIGDLALARAADQPNARLVLDPVQGLFGLAFASREGALGDPVVRRALSMAIDRDALVAAFGVRGLEPRLTLLPGASSELPRPAMPSWAAVTLAVRRQEAAAAIAELGGGRLRLRVAMPDGGGYRIAFAHLRRDWAAIGVEAIRVRPQDAADLRLIDAVAPAVLATWYLRFFTCDAALICDSTADQALAAARAAPTIAERRIQLGKADELLTSLTTYIPLTAPVRWSLVAQRLNGFRANPFARHAAGELIAEER